MSDGTAATDPAIRYQLDGDVAVVYFDDGKANVLTHSVIEALHAALGAAESDGARAVAIIGRPGKFCAGFDLSVMTAGPDQARDLLRAGAVLGRRIYTFPVPVLLGATGHALAMGAILLMAADVRIGADGPFKIGLPEVEIGMPLPRFAVELARDRLSPRYFVPATQHAVVTTPAEAIGVGFLDRVVAPDDVEATTLSAARDLADRLQPAPFVLTRENCRGGVAAIIDDALDADMAAFTVQPT
ncbi:MAG TPA: crotonase/enoyl-CoA hydratase family protein [Acidimicrobiales bacterium]|nr:crotonase/enoyl-CoA hydratase family protein [Acidimicrobiales bacterium]